MEKFGSWGLSVAFDSKNKSERIRTQTKKNDVYCADAESR